MLGGLGWHGVGCGELHRDGVCWVGWGGLPSLGCIGA